MNSVTHDVIRDGLVRLIGHMRREGYRGWDPYDALTSPLFRLPVLRSAWLLRFGAQQALKRSPVNLRPLLGIRKQHNVVTDALSLEAFTSLGSVERQALGVEGEEQNVLERIRESALRWEGRVAWGYPFDWEARHARVKAGMPTVVATSFVCNALFAHWRATGDARCPALLEGAAQFVLRDLARIPFARGFCFSYTTDDRQAVINATAKAARVLVQSAVSTGEQTALDTARETLQFVADAQQPSGAWPYSANDARTWVDCYHTGYVLDCLDEYRVLTVDRSFDDVIERGFEYFRRHFVMPNGIVRAYDTATFPIDPTAAAQAILTLVRFGESGLARRVGEWMVANMQGSDGHFYFQKGRLLTNRIPYMRWSDAWMLNALAVLVHFERAPRHS